MGENNVATMDQTLDLDSALSALTGGDATSVAETPVATAPVTPEVAPAVEEPKSALDRAMEAKAKAREEGGIETDEKLAEEESGALHMNWDNDESNQETRDAINDVWGDIEKAKAVVVIKEPKSREEYFQMHDEVSRVKFDANGNAILPEDAQFIVLKNEKIIKIMEERKAAADAAKDKTEDPTKKEEAGKAAAASVNPEDPNYMTPDDAAKAYKGGIVKILIDKTGIGANIHFDEEEKKVISTSNEIQLIEVEERDLLTIDVIRPESDGKSFMQTIEANTESLSRTPMIFPNSGFEASMTGLNWGEYADVALNPDYEPNEGYNDIINFDKLYKRYSIIYNNMKNISVGPFKDFEDFLKKFAHDDLQLALYGILVATQPEQDSLYLNCGRCGKRFLYNYSPRTVIDMDTPAAEAIEKMNEITGAGPDMKLKLFKESRVNKFKRVQLPRSKYLIDIGATSAYDFLYQVLPVKRDIVLEAWRHPNHELPITDPRRVIPDILLGVRAAHVPAPGGRYYSATSGRDIADVIMALPNEDANVLSAAIQAYRKQYIFDYTLKEVVCTHCGHEENNIYLTPEHLVFQIRLHQISTNVTVKNFPSF